MSCQAGKHPPRLDVKNSSPKARPLDAEEYVSAISDCTHGITSARPRPFHALKLIACTTIAGRVLSIIQGTAVTSDSYPHADQMLPFL